MLKFGLCETNFAFVTEIHCGFLMCTGVMLSPLNLAKSRMAMKQKETLRQTNFSASKQPARSGESQHNNNGMMHAIRSAQPSNSTPCCTKKMLSLGVGNFWNLWIKVGRQNLEFGTRMC